jgi:hypothetical protein
MSRCAILGLGLLALVSTPTNAQFANQGNWGNEQYQPRSNGADQVLCDVERYARIVGNVASALRDRGGAYGNWGGGYGCQQVSYRYQDQYRYVPDYPTYPPYQYPASGSYYQTPRTFVPISPGGGNMCIRTSSGLTIC